MRLFEQLVQLLFPARPTEALVRNALPDHLAARTTAQSFDASGISAVALLPYHDALAHAAIVEAKFYANEKAQELLGSVLAEYLLERLGEDAAFGGTAACLVPVPLGEMRRHERGYNQCERICEAAARRLGLAVRMKPNVLKRIKDTVPQTDLSGRERRKNMQGAFRVEPGLDTERTYIVVDDVMTTGATLHAAAAALRAAGATRIIPLALAH